MDLAVTLLVVASPQAFHPSLGSGRSSHGSSKLAISKVLALSRRELRSLLELQKVRLAFLM
jgi:hypothetical protein